MQTLQLQRSCISLILGDIVKFFLQGNECNREIFKQRIEAMSTNIMSLVKSFFIETVKIKYRQKGSKGVQCTYHSESPVPKSLTVWSYRKCSSFHGYQSMKHQFSVFGTGNFCYSIKLTPFIDQIQ